MKTVDELMAAARAAQAQVANYTQEQIDEVCLAIGWSVYNDENIHQLSKLAVEETGYGNYESKVVKHKRKIGGVLHDIQGAISVGLLERNEETGISKYAKPVGVVLAILPATNPTATAGGKVISIVKGRNAAIVRASSRAKACTKLAVDFMRAGLEKIGAPVDLIQYVEGADRENTAELMRKCDLVCATGSGSVVKAAYSSGTPAYGVGVGNAVAIIAEDADVPDAVKKVHASKIFDNATSCSSENSIIVHESVYDQVCEEIVKVGGYICSKEERETLKNHMWKPNKKGALTLNPAIIAQSAMVIAGQAGLNVPEGTTMIVVKGEEPAELDRFSDEKISPVLTMFKYSTFDQGMDILIRITDHFGTGHSSGIHTFNRDYIHHMGMVMKSSRITVRQPMSAANGGHPFNRMPSTATLGCGTWGGNSTTENVHYKHFLNVTWVNEPVEPWSFTDEEMWGEFWKKHGK